MPKWLFGEDAYDPASEAQFAQLLSGGMQGPTDNVGSSLMNLIPMLLGSYGLERQGKARDTEMQAAAQQEGESLAAILAGLGIESDPDTASTLAGNPALLKALARAQPEEPTPEKMYDSAREYSLWRTRAAKLGAWPVRTRCFVGARLPAVPRTGPGTCRASATISIESDGPRRERVLG